MQIVVIILGVVIILLGAILIFVPDQDSTPVEPIATKEVTLPEATEDTRIAVVEDQTEPKGDTAAVNNPPNQSISTPVQTDSAPTNVNTFTADVSYLTPARTSHDMKVSLTVDNAGVVTDANIIYDNGDGFSNGHQERFDKAYKTEVIGKSLENISLSRVGGASLTSGGFNEAVAKIRAERG